MHNQSNSITVASRTHLPFMNFEFSKCLINKLVFIYIIFQPFLVIFWLNSVDFSHFSVIFQSFSVIFGRFQSYFSQFLAFFLKLEPILFIFQPFVVIFRLNAVDFSHFRSISIVFQPIFGIFHQNWGNFNRPSTSSMQTPKFDKFWLENSSHFYEFRIFQNAWLIN